MSRPKAAQIRHGTCDFATTSDDDGWHRLVFADGMPTAVLLRRDLQTDVWLRGRIEGAEVVRTDGADVDWAWPGAVDLGADLLGSPEARPFASSPIGSAMRLRMGAGSSLRAQPGGQPAVPPRAPSLSPSRREPRSAR